MDKIVFNLTPTEDAESTKPLGNVVNITSGMAIDELLEVIRKHIPSAAGDETCTVKTIIRTHRTECGCCPTMISALVLVDSNGRVSDETKKIRGLYEVTIVGATLHGDGQDGSVRVSKLSSTSIYQDNYGRLPRKFAE